jgi:spore maturation protein CgeB
MLTGISTIRIFEALACGIPLVSAPWEDCEGLFTLGEDFLMARNGAEMRSYLEAIYHDRDWAETMARHGRATIEARHSCAHRVDELISICQALGRYLCPPQAVAAQ